MKDTTRMKFIKDVDVNDTAIKVRRPFRLDRENQRRFVRLEISSPTSLNKIKDIFGNFWPVGEGYTIDGDILNISAGGVLIEIDQPLNEGDIVDMRFSLQGDETLDNVLGTVKRVDQDESCYLVGIEFIGRDYLLDRLSEGEMQMLSENLSDFTQTVHDVLKKYIYRERVVSHGE
jgi:hypothetical protein